jgi:lipopolysaccharide/colanic/teichoic acid biosynthesis glycosyltransferase
VAVSPAAQRIEAASRTSTSIPRKGRILKRTIDILGAAFLLLLLGPLVVLLAVIVRLSDGGPAFHRRRVIGLNADFDAFKLRTMRVDADDVLRRNPELLREYEINFKLENDPRVTRLGAFLRKTSLDELPQLWNVLKGEMSLVGPRMITPAEFNKYGDAGWIFRSLKPGLTGYWQINGRQTTSYDRRVEMDLFYAQNWSLSLDVTIILKTPLTIFRGAGAF